MKNTILTMTVAVWLTVTAVMAADRATQLSQGKLDADLGKHDAAAASFQAVADDTRVAAATRAEALIRLALVRQKMGDTAGASQAYERVWSEHRADKGAMGQLVHAVTGLLPSGKYWDENWQGATFVVDDVGPRFDWPGVTSGRRAYKGEPISLDTKNGELKDVFRLFADISKLNVVVFPGAGGGAGTLTYTAHEVPWDQALHTILAPNGLDYRWTDNVLTIAPPAELGTARADAPAAAKRYTGAPVDLDFKDAELRGVLAKIAEAAGSQVTFHPAIAGRVTLKLKQVAWDQALDLVARTNGIAWTQHGNVIAVHGRKASPGSDQQPFLATRLDTVSIDDIRLRGIVRTGSRYVALFACPENKTCFGSAADRLQDGEIKAVDATTVTFRRRDGTESRQSLYPSSR